MYKNLSKINKEKNLTSLKRKIILCFLIRHVANDDTSFDYVKLKLSLLAFTTNKKTILPDKQHSLIIFFGI